MLLLFLALSNGFILLLFKICLPLFVQYFVFEIYLCCCLQQYFIHSHCLVFRHVTTTIYLSIWDSVWVGFQFGAAVKFLCLWCTSLNISDGCEPSSRIARLGLCACSALVSKNARHDSHVSFSLYQFTFLLQCSKILVAPHSHQPFVFSLSAILLEGNGISLVF